MFHLFFCAILHLTLLLFFLVQIITVWHIDFDTTTVAVFLRHFTECNRDDMLYAEPTLQGNAVIAKRKEGDVETQVNLELLFNYKTQANV